MNVIQNGGYVDMFEGAAEAMVLPAGAVLLLCVLMHPLDHIEGILAFSFV